MDSIFNLICSVVIMVLLMGFVKDIHGPHVQRKNVIIMITLDKNSNIEPVLCLCLVSLLVASVETQGWSVRAGITVAKVFQKELNQMFVSDWTQKKLLFVPIQRPASIVLLLWSSYVKKFTCKLDYLHLSGSCTRAFFEKSFQWKWGLQNQRNPII